MFTDVVEFTALGQADEELALQLLEEHRGLVRPIVARHGGVEVKTIGDAFLVEYASALEAVKSAVEIQKTLHDRNTALPEERRVRLRIGIHVGDVVHAGGDILGDAVDVSSRIEPLATPGGVCSSEQVYDHVRNKMGIPFERMEEKTLKNVSIPIDVYRIIMPWESMEDQKVSNDTRRIAVLGLVVPPLLLSP
jgi:adenylate cyclase